jgi:hypothetical protein
VPPSTPPSPAAPAPTSPEARPAGTPPAQKQVPSLLSGETLRGTSAFSAEAGWSRLSGAYAQGLAADKDLGGFISYDYATTELRVGPSFRQALAKVPPFDTALRLYLAFYSNGGGTWIYSKNHSDSGFELGAGVSFSQHAANGVVSLLADLPGTFTFHGNGGFVLAPRAGVAYETSISGPFTLGVHGAVGYRFGVGDAPFKGGLGEASLLVVGGYRVY